MKTDCSCNSTRLDCNRSAAHIDRCTPFQLISQPAQPQLTPITSARASSVMVGLPWLSSQTTDSTRPIAAVADSLTLELHICLWPLACVSLHQLPHPLLSHPLHTSRSLIAAAQQPPLSDSAPIFTASAAPFRLLSQSHAPLRLCHVDHRSPRCRDARCSLIRGGSASQFLAADCRDRKESHTHQAHGGGAEQIHLQHARCAHQKNEAQGVTALSGCSSVS